MKILLAILVVLFSAFTTAFEAKAHVGNSQPFILLNGNYVLPNDIRGTIIKEMNIAGDIAPETYSTGEKIVFEIDTGKTLISSEVLQKTKFYWDFGDGQTSEGVKSSHAYEKTGSYTVQLSAGYLENPHSVLDSLFLNVIPNDKFTVPTAVITINGKKISDPKNELTAVKPGQAVKLEASFNPQKSEAKYLWDLGDGTSSSERQLTHTYPVNYTFTTPVLKAQDESGFISYAYANVEFSQNPTGANSSNNRSFVMKAIGAGTIILLLAIYILRKKFKLKSS